MTSAEYLKKLSVSLKTNLKPMIRYNDKGCEQGRIKNV